MLSNTLRAAALTLLASTAFAGEGHNHGDHSGHGAHAGHGEMAVLATTDTGLVIKDGFARAATSVSKSGAAFLLVENTGDTADRLIDASSDAAQRVELHTHIDNGDGVFRMVHVPEGFELAPGATLKLARGGKHVMLMGLNAPMLEGGEVAITLTFERAGDVEVMVPVDLERGAGHGHGGHGHNHDS
ncbi:copper chaperone PCu(A)C [Pseudaestuariivita sp.]|uniref:copper chaperone PCu(A)C n=1 Tax=Pseudaestuariivita sp. TaxID=2211669 RepID=UPI004057F40C